MCTRFVLTSIKTNILIKATRYPLSIIFLAQSSSIVGIGKLFVVIKFSECTVVTALKFDVKYRHIWYTMFTL